MEINSWLTINNKGAVRISKNKPNLDWNEVSIKLNIEVPDTLFTRPIIQADLKLIGEFNNISSMEVKQNLKEIIEQNKNLHLVNINILKDDTKEVKKENGN